KAAIAFRKTGDVRNLQNIQLPVLEEILKTTAVSQGRAIDISDLLDFYARHPNSVNECLKELKSEWDLNEPPESVPWLLEAPFVWQNGKKKEELTVRITLNPPIREEPRDGDEAVAFDNRWTGEDDDTCIVASRSNKSTPESLSAGQIEL